jgi:sirohydrochlorin ferrochelatase
MRTARRRPSGRHRSPDRLSVPSTAPALVLAIPGAACGASDEISTKIAAYASGSCPGVVVRAGYLEGTEANLAAVLAAVRASGNAAPAAVVVPILTAPHPWADAALAKAIAEAGVPVVLTGPLGPHPLLGEVLHTRLAEAGLARAGRMREISIAAAAEGIIVAAASGAPGASAAGSGGALAGVQEAGIVAVLLAARLAAPVVPASLGNAASLREAAERLRDARATNLALAPCVIGPETSQHELAAAAAETGARSAQPLGAHPAIGRLVAMRYGAALQDPRIAGAAGVT